MSSLETREDGERGARDAPQILAAAQPKARPHSGLQWPETQKWGRGQLLRPDSQELPSPSPWGLREAVMGAPRSPHNKRKRGWRPPRALPGTAVRGDDPTPHPRRSPGELGAGQGERDEV